MNTQTACRPLLAADTALGIGMGGFVDGIILHQLLHIHHLTETDNHLVWDLAFLLSGLVMILVGWIIIHHGRNSTLDNPPVKSL